MKTLAEAIQQTTASPRRIFELWSDVNNWSQFDESVEWTRLDGAFESGGRFILKPRGGPKAIATIISLEADKEFTNTSPMPGAILTFAHSVAKNNGTTTVRVVASIEGLLGWLWAGILGKGLKRALEKSTLNLVRLAEEPSRISR